MQLAVADFLAFEMQEVFPSDELLSEWIATLALAFNDVSLVHARMVEDQDSAHEFFYWLRLAISHFSEAADYLIHTREIPEVHEFVASLPAAAQENYKICMKLYELRTSEIQQIRNVATFHLWLIAWPVLTNAPEAEGRRAFATRSSRPPYFHPWAELSDSESSTSDGGARPNAR